MLGVGKGAFWAGIWRAGMSVYLYIHLFVCQYVQASVHMSASTYLCLYISPWVCMSVSISIGPISIFD